MGTRGVLLSLFLCFTASLLKAQQPPKPDFRAQLAHATSDSQRVSIYRSVFTFYTNTTVDSATPYIEQGLQHFIESGYRSGQGSMLLLLSNINNQHGMLVVAKDKAEQAMKIFMDLKDDANIVKAYACIGNAQNYMGDYTGAVKTFLSSIKYLERVHDTVGLINTNLELGAANDYNGSHDKALEYYHKALDLSLRTKENDRIVYLYNNIGLSYARNEQFDTALKYFEKAEVLSRKPEYIKTRLHPLLNLGKVYDAKGDTKKALAYLQQALIITKSLNTPEPICRVLLEMGRIESRINPNNTASLNEGLNMARSLDLKRLQADFLSALALAADKTGNYKEEVSLIKQSQVIKDSMFNVSKSKEIANLQAEYDLKRTSSQLAALELAEQRNKQKKDLIIVIAVILAVTLVTLLVFFTRGRRLNRELTDSERDLKKANAIKDRLFSIIGHDLKGPIGNIPSLLSIYKDERSTANEKTQIFKAMEESAHASVDTLDKLLNWGRQQIKGNTFNPTLLDVEEIMNNKMKLFGSAAANKNITIVNKIPGNIRVYADENHFKFILRNLISNAVKFTHPGGMVEITATHTPGYEHITFSVKDNGIGIDKDKHQHIFEAHNESRPGTANESGTSIGLMLCKEFVIQNGGNIWVESEKEKGSSFSFTVKGDPQKN